MANLNIGDKAIPFNLPGVDGKSRSLGDYAEKKAVVVIFTCNHCPYARMGGPHCASSGRLRGAWSSIVGDKCE